VDFEVVLVDDGSTDGTRDIASSLEPNVRVLIGPHRGVSSARNRGISETRGDWIVFLDADDLLLPDTLRKRLDAIDGAVGDVVICDWQEFVETVGGAACGPVRSVNFAALSATPEIACATDVWAPTAALMFRRGLVETIGGFREGLSIIQDARFLFDAAYHNARFMHAPHVGAYYRVQPNSLSRRDPVGFWRDVLLNGQQIERLWRLRGVLTKGERRALAQIYNGAAISLFRAGEPTFRDAIYALRRSDLQMTWRNRVIEIATKVLGQRTAGKLISLWTRLRQPVSKRPFCSLHGG
jgi:glycosyltransferase involved in cell wall biosynthesis